MRPVSWQELMTRLAISPRLAMRMRRSFGVAGDGDDNDGDGDGSAVEDGAVDADGIIEPPWWGTQVAE